MPKQTGQQRRLRAILLPLLSVASAASAAPGSAGAPGTVPARQEGSGPYQRLVLRNVIIVDGTGAPAQGPYDVVVSGDRITEMKSIGAPGALDPAKRAKPGDQELDLTGYYLLPGFIDTHVHLHTEADGQKVSPEYVLKLWMSHGITSVRDVGSGQSIEWLRDLKQRSERNTIVAPRISVYPFFHDISEDPVVDVEAARRAVRDAERRGADGIKFIGGDEAILMAALDEAESINLPTTMHHAQQSVRYANVLTTSARGLDSVEHWYGIPEAMFEDRTIQDFPTDFINNDEQMRFGQAGRLWRQAAKPGSETWNSLIATLIDRDVIL